MSLDYYHWNQEMPLARVAIAEDGTLSVWMMGIPRQVPPDLLHKDRMGLVLDHLYRDRGGPYDVEIIEPDGTIKTGPVALPADDVAVWEAGFIPREPVAVAYIAGNTTATTDGQLGMTLPRQTVANLATGEVILFGRQSGTTVICQPLGPR
jgi:hypothetical protein